MGALISFLFGKVFSFFTLQTLTAIRSYGMLIAFITFSVGFISMFIAQFNAISQDLQVSVPQWVVIGWGLFMPSNAKACLLAVVSIRVLSFLFLIKIGLLKRFVLHSK